MGLFTQAITRVPGPSLDILSRRRAVELPQTGVATDVAFGQQRYIGKSSVDLYRAWSIHGEWVRAAIDIRNAQLAQAEWDLVPFDREARTPDPGLVRRIRELLQQPNPTRKNTGTFFLEVGEDVNVLDAGTIEKERTYGGEIAYLWAADGGRVKVDKEWVGDPRMPRYYFQVGPIDFVPLLDRDLTYILRHPRSYSPVGISPLETLKMVIDAELSGSLFNARMVSQAAPDGIMDLGETARPDQVTSFSSFWKTEIEGKRAMAFWGGTKGAKFIQFRRTNQEMQFIEWTEYLVRKTAAVFQLSSQDLNMTFDINKATGEVQQQQTDDRGVKPYLSDFQNFITTEICWDPGWGGRANNIAFRFVKVSRRDSLQLAQQHKLTLAGVPSQTVNEARLDMGLPPIGNPHDENNPYNQLMANTAQGFVLLDEVASAYDAVMAKVEAAQKQGVPALSSGGSEVTAKEAG